MVKRDQRTEADQTGRSNPKRQKSDNKDTEASSSSSVKPSQRLKATTKTIKTTTIKTGPDPDPKPKPNSNPNPNSDSSKTINLARIESLLDKYENLIPEKLKELDEKRYITIPNAVTARASGKGGEEKLYKDNDTGKEKEQEVVLGRYLNKSEFVNLVEWKLKHGTFRPSLLGMAKQHDDEHIEEITSEAFGYLQTSDERETMNNGMNQRDDNNNNNNGSSGVDDEEKIEETMKSLRLLSTLRGIGPATASLFLSIGDVSNTTPFFSDELFRWIMWDEPSSSGLNGWDRKIGYTVKEYKRFLELVQIVLRREDMQSGESRIGAMELEKVAYVLARE